MHRERLCWITALIIGGALCLPGARAAERFVGTDPGDYATIQAAINASNNPGDVVTVRDGVWTGANNRDLDFSQGLPSGRVALLNWEDQSCATAL